MSIVSGSLAATMGSSAQNRASKRQAISVRNTNAANMLMSFFARGAPIPATIRGIGDTGLEGYQSAVLPYYFGPEGEAGLADAARAIFDATGRDMPEDQLRQYQAIIDSLSAPVASGDQLLSDVFSGRFADKKVANLQPAFQARKDAAMEALEETLNRTDAIRREVHGPESASWALASWEAGLTERQRWNDET